MKSKYSILFALGILTSHALALPGIPEPGMIFYGRVTNTGANTALPINSLTWAITEPGTGRIVNLSVGSGIEIVTHNLESWFIARIPFQTIAVTGVTFDPLPANTFALSTTAISYNRSALTVNGVVATIQAPATTTASLPDLGATPARHAKMERVDLQISSSNQALYDAWISTYFPLNDPRALANADPDNDGIQNLLERALGLHPNAHSIVPISTGSILVSGQNYLTFTYRQSPSSPDTQLKPVITSDLQNWNSGPGALVEISNVLDGDTRLITVRSATPMSSSTRSFIRLEATPIRP